MPFPAVLQLSGLNGTNGFTLPGLANGSSTGNSVSSAGDVNGDGIEDFIVGAPRINGSAGAAYVVFGTDTGFPSSFNLGGLNGTNGFRIDGGHTWTGVSVSSAGDINKDGFDDIIVGAASVLSNATGTGEAYVIFGKGTAFGATVSSASLTGTNGFRIIGEGAGDRLGYSVSGAGDVNGDGFDDIIVGASTLGADNAGVSYVVFGTNAAFSATINLAGLNGSNGFRLNGSSVGRYSGWDVSSAGDINNDGYDDMLVGARAPNSSNAAVYVVLGKQSGFAQNLNLEAMTGGDGYIINGGSYSSQLGWSVSSAGDVNGDGFGDIIFSGRYAETAASYSGAAYVVFGKADGFSNISIASLNGTTGFRMVTNVGYDRVGQSVSAGDLNGDGFSDLIVGVSGRDTNGDSSGSVYVVYGKSTAFSATVNLTTGLGGTAGFEVRGVAAGNWTGTGVGVADVNGDGGIDLLIGAGGYSSSPAVPGAAYVIYGDVPLSSFAGTPGDDDLSGTAGGDTADGGAGKDILRGLGGDDTLDGGAAADVLYGGDNNDTLGGDAGSDILYGDAGVDELDGGDGNDKLFGGAGADTLNGGTGNDRMDGESDIDTLNGGAGNDYLDGGLGADIMSGGTENDVYIVDDFGDQTIENSGEGIDIVRTALDGWVLAANIEALELQGSADIDGTGNDGGNSLVGNSGANTLSGLEGNDSLNGGDGDDTLIGGTGGDQLRGGIGADTFVVAHTPSGALEIDRIYDFSAAEGDIVDLSGAFAGTIEKVDGFSKAAGQMTLIFAGGITTLSLDVTGDGKSDYQLKINGDVTQESGDWIL